ncbi:Dual specificity protein kinase clk4 [Mactra antiquata]
MLPEAHKGDSTLLIDQGFYERKLAGKLTPRYVKDTYSEDHEALFKLISDMLEYEQDKRVTTKTALRHEFLSQYYTSTRDRSYLLQEQSPHSSSHLSCTSSRYHGNESNGKT